MKFDQMSDRSQHVPFIRKDVLVANVLTLEGLNIKHKCSSINYVLYMHPDTLEHYKFKVYQCAVVNSNILLEVHCSKSVPLGSIAVSESLFVSIFESSSDMVIIEKCKQKHWTSAWICYLSTKSLINHDITSSFNPFRGKKFICENESIIADYFGSVVRFEVAYVVSKRNFKKKEINDNIALELSFCSLEKSRRELYLVSECTKFVMMDESRKKTLCLDHIGGMLKIKESLKFFIEEYFGGSSPVSHRGCLLHGLEGSGKSSLVAALADNYKLPLLIPQSPDIFSEDIEEYLSNLASWESLVSRSSPCIVLLENVESFCPAETISKHPNGCCFGEHFNTFLYNMSLTKCFVIACTKDIQLINKSIKFFELVFEVPVPSNLERFQILKGLIKYHEICHDFSEDDIKVAADMAHGFSGFDLNKICMTMKMKQTSSKMTKDEFFELICSCGPSILREAAFECPNVKWEDVGGQEKLKDILKWSIVKPVEDPFLFKKHTIKGILLYGPPGCSKTMIVKALATECGLNFLWIQGSQLHGKYVGDSERAIKVLFKRARGAAPCVIFFDELDAFAPKRGSGKDAGGVTDRCVSLLMTEMDGILSLKNVYIVAATNRPDHIDQALLRAGRFDIRQYVSLPDLDTRKKILKDRCKKGSVDEDVDVDILVEKTAGFSCAEVSSLYELAGCAAFEEDCNTDKIKMKHFLKVVSNMVPMTKAETLQLYEQMKFPAF